MIITFGSLNADLIYRVDTVPENGQTVSSCDFSLQAGGKGANQAAAAALDGAQVIMAGAVGCDPLGEVAVGNLEAVNVDIACVARVDRPTGNAVVVVDSGGGNRIIVSAGANALAAEDSLSDDLLRACNCVLLQMETPAPEVETLLLRCKILGVRTILNLAPARHIRLDALRSVGILVVNEDEAETLSEELGCAASARGLSAALGCDVVRTIGDRGAEASHAGEYFHIPARRVTPVDTTAAGDCFIGVLASGLDRGLDLRAAMERASLAASLCCTRAGSQLSLPCGSETDQLQTYLNSNET